MGAPRSAGPQPRDNLRPALPSGPQKPKKAGRAHFFRNLARVGSGGKARAHSSRRRTTAPPAEIPGLLVARLLVGALHSGVVDQAGDRLAVADVGLEDLLQVRLLDAAVPDVVGVHDDHRAVATLRETAGLVDADLGLAARLHGLVAQVLHELLDVALGRARIDGGADEDMCFVLPHHWASTAAILAALRSAMNLSTSSRIACTISFSGTFLITSPFLKMRPIPRPPATPMSAARASPGPLTSHPITAMWISSLSPLNSSSTCLASLTRSTSALPQEGHETKVRPPLRSPSDFKMSIPTRTSSVGSAESDTRIVSPMPSESSAPSPIADLIVPTPGVPASVTPRWNG